MTAQKMPPARLVRAIERARHVLGRAHQRSVPAAGAMMDMILWAWRVQGISVAAELKIEINPELALQIDIDDPTPQLGYPFGKKLLERGVPFTALFAYNDISAIGAIRAFREAGLEVPQDVSVVGFDDIQSAAYNTPSLTTVRQPMIRMGTIAAQTLLERLEGRTDFPAEIAIAPELVVRESTAKLSSAASFRVSTPASSTG